MPHFPTGKPPTLTDAQKAEWAQMRTKQLYPGMTITTPEQEKARIAALEEAKRLREPPREPVASASKSTSNSAFYGTKPGTWLGIRAGRRKTLRAKFDRCVKSVRKTVRARKGSNADSAAIAICTKTVLHPRGKTLKRYRKGRLTTQRRKLRGGGGKEDLQAVYNELVVLPPDAESYTPTVPQQTIDSARAFVEQAYAAKQASEGTLTKLKKFFGSRDSQDLVDFLKELKTGVHVTLGAAGAEKASYESAMLKYLQA